MNLVTRDQWGARPRKNGVPLQLPVPDVIVHHTVGPMPTSPAAEVMEMRRIQAFHMDSRGWADIGYNFVIGPSGTVYDGRNGYVGAHAGTAELNKKSIGICLMGNFESATRPTGPQVSALVDLIVHLQKVGGISLPIRISGHRDVKATACPGTQLYSLLPDVRVRVNEKLSTDMVQKKETPVMSELGPNQHPTKSPVVAVLGHYDKQTGKLVGYTQFTADGGVFNYGEGGAYFGRVVLQP